MLAASPITRQTVGRTFIVALSLLGTVAAAQIGIIVWAYVARLNAPPALTGVPTGSEQFVGKLYDDVRNEAVSEGI